MKLTLGKFGLTSDPVGGHCVMDWQGRTLLGQVKEVYRNETTGMTHLRVRHMCGDPWPIDPHCLAVDMLARTYED